MLFARKAKISEILNSVPLNVSFRRAVLGIKLLEWNDLVARKSQFTIRKRHQTWLLGL